MRCIDLFTRDHPDLDPERAILENCPADFGIKAPAACGPESADLGNCRRCWLQEAAE